MITFNITLAEVAEMTGIPAATLAGLRDGSLVAVPREPTDAMVLQGWLHLSRLRPDTGHVTRVYRAMLAAAQEPDHD